MKLFICLLFSVLVISACSFVSIDEQTETPQPLLPTPTLVRGDLTWEQSLLVSQLSKQLGISVNDIVVAETAAVNWQDDCLGSKSNNRICNQGVVPGFRFILVVNGKQYEYHTKKDMTEILLIEDQ